MNSRQLQYAILLSEVRSFSQAAEELGISQPAFSKQILALENDLGLKLFDRTTNPLSLTPAGEYFVKKAADIIFEEDVLTKTMERFKTGENGRLTIGISPFRSLYMMPPVIKALKERYPGLQIVLSEYGRNQLHKGILEGIYDFIITNLPVDESRLDIIPLEKDTLVLAVPENLLPLMKTSTAGTVDLKDCKSLPFVVVSTGQELRQLFDKLCKLSRFDPNIFVEVIGVTSAWEMVKSGIPAAILPKQFIHKESVSSSVTMFDLSQAAQTRQPAVVTRRGQFVSEYAKYAIEILTSQLNEFQV